MSTLSGWKHVAKVLDKVEGELLVLISKVCQLCLGLVLVLAAANEPKCGRHGYPCSL